MASGSIRTPEILRKNRSLATASAAEQEALRQYVDSLKQANIEKTSENVGVYISVDYMCCQKSINWVIVPYIFYADYNTEQLGEDSGGPAAQGRGNDCAPE